MKACGSRHLFVFLGRHQLKASILLEGRTLLPVDRRPVRALGLCDFCTRLRHTSIPLVDCSTRNCGLCLCSARQKRRSRSHGQRHVILVRIAVMGFAVAVFALGKSHASALHALTLTGLTIVLGVLAFALMRLAFAQGFLSKPYLTDATRRSLALTGAQQLSLGLAAAGKPFGCRCRSCPRLGPCSRTRRVHKQPCAGLLHFVHPADEMAYHKCLDLRRLRADT